MSVAAATYRARERGRREGSRRAGLGLL